MDTPDAGDFTPLMRAAEKGYEGCVRLLCMNADCDLERANRDGVTPACIAAQNSLECLRLIHEAASSRQCLSSSAVLCVQNPRNGWTPAHYAASKCNLQCLRFLADCGCPLNVTNHLGETPAHLVVGCSIKKDCQISCLKLLCDSGQCSLHLRNSTGQETAMLAAKMDNCDCLWMILEASADSSTQMSKELKRLDVQFEPSISKDKAMLVSRYCAVVNFFQTHAGWSLLFVAARHGSL